MTCDVEGCDSPDVGTIHGQGQYCIDCLVVELNENTERTIQQKWKCHHCGNEVHATTKPLTCQCGIAQTLVPASGDPQ